MGHQDDRNRQVRAQIDQFALQANTGDLVDGGKWFVEQQYIGLARQRAVSIAIGISSRTV